MQKRIMQRQVFDGTALPSHFVGLAVSLSSAADLRLERAFASFAATFSLTDGEGCCDPFRLSKVITQC